MNFSSARVVVVLGLALATARADEPIVVMPKLEVTADVLAAMLPCEQVNELSREATRRFKTFDLTKVVAVRTAAVPKPKPLRCFIRSQGGAVRREITNERAEFTVDPSWGDGYLSANEREEEAGFYFLLQPRFRGEQITVGELVALLEEYTEFARYQLKRAVTHYGAARAPMPGLFWRVMGNEIVCQSRTEADARMLAERCGVKPAGTVVRLSREQLSALHERNGAAWVVAAQSAVACVTPWSNVLPPPRVAGSAAQFRIGWVEFRVDALVRREIIIAGMW